MRRALLLVLVSACAPTTAQLALRDVDQDRVAAHQTPGAAEAAAYAQAIHGAVIDHAYVSGDPRLVADVDDALAILDRATAAGGADAPTLVAWRGLLLTDAGRYDQALAELQRSMQLGPNLLAAKNLVVIWGAAARPDQVGALCASTVPALSSGQEQFELIELCKDNMHAISDDAALAWASPEIVSFYRQERARRDDAEAADAQRAADAEAQKQAVGHEQAICGDGCNERAYRCEGRCASDDVDCKNACVDTNNACVDACEHAADEQLGQ